MTRPKLFPANSAPLSATQTINSMNSSTCGDVWSSVANATNSGTITANGGNGLGTGSGGDCGHFELVGATASNSGDVSLNGGNGDLTNGYGGDSNQVLIVSLFGNSSNTAESISLLGGTGQEGEAGANGEVFVDGMNMTDNFMQ